MCRWFIILSTLYTYSLVSSINNILSFVSISYSVPKDVFIKLRFPPTISPSHFPSYKVKISSHYKLKKIIGSQGNWRTGYQTAASIQFAILLLLIATITLWGKTKISVSSASVRHASGLSFRTMVRMPGVKEICCMFITSCGIEYTCGNWCSTFLVENKNMPIANAAQVVMLYYIGRTLGRFCSGLLAVRLHSWKIIRLGQIVLGAGILLLFMPFLTTSVIGFFLIGFGNGPYFQT